MTGILRGGDLDIENTEEQPHEDTEGSHLQTNEKGLKRQPPC